MHFVASSKVSYTIQLVLRLDGTSIVSTQKINLQVSSSSVLALDPH